MPRRGAAAFKLADRSNLPVMGLHDGHGCVAMFLLKISRITCRPCDYLLRRLSASRRLTPSPARCRWYDGSKTKATTCRSAVTASAPAVSVLQNPPPSRVCCILGRAKNGVFRLNSTQVLRVLKRVFGFDHARPNTPRTPTAV